MHNFGIKGTGLIELFVLLIVVVVTSALVLLLVKFNVLTVKVEAESEPLLNAEFIPYAREGTLLVRDFQFCTTVDEYYQCLGEANQFTFNQQIHFRYAVESSLFAGEAQIIKNYRIRGPSGTLLLDVGEEQQFQIPLQSEKPTEIVQFKDYFIIQEGANTGDYALELVIENPLVAKTVVVTKQFKVES